MRTPWQILFYKDEHGKEPVQEFFAMPSKIGITQQEKALFDKRLGWVMEKGLDIMKERKDVLEPIKGQTNLYALRIPHTTNNPRVLLCAHLQEANALVLLHAFKEKRTKDYQSAIDIANARKASLEMGDES